MTDAQVMTLALSIAVPLSLLIYSNSRITDTRDRVLAEIGKVAAELSAKLDALAIKVDAIKADANQAVRIHELEYHK